MVPSRPSTSPWWKPRSSSSVSACAWVRNPGRSSRPGAGSAAAAAAGTAGPPEPVGGRTSAASVPDVVAAPPWNTAAPVRSDQPTTVSMVTRAAAGGSATVTVSRVLVQAYPMVLARLRRAASTSARTAASGSTSRGSSDTSSPTVTSLPSRASRSSSAGTTAAISGGPVRITRRAATTGHRCDRHRVTGPYAEVAEQEVVGVQQVPATARLRPGHDAGGDPATGQSDRVTGMQTQRGEHGRMQPDDAAAGVQGRRSQVRGENEIGLGHRPSVAAVGIPGRSSPRRPPRASRLALAAPE